MSQAPATPPGANASRLPTDDELREVAASLRGMRFGSVTIVVQDGVIIQIDKTEKRRLRNRREASENAQT
ncbi:MAG: YezD family protein [Planctomycetaceae bacterium]|nr:YezD family protein [Lacipirellula limnantheis]MBL9161787.1 YezD family protein [Planctomycetaceae bacterium]